MRGALFVALLLAPVAAAAPATFELANVGVTHVDGESTLALDSPAGFWVGSGGQGGSFHVRTGTLAVFEWREAGASAQGGGSSNVIGEPTSDEIPVDGATLQLVVSADDDGGVLFSSEATARLRGLARGASAPQVAVTTTQGNALPVAGPQVWPYAVPTIDWAWEEGDILIGNSSAEGYTVHGFPDLGAPTLTVNGTAQLAIHDGIIVIGERQVELGNWSEEGVWPGSSGAGVRRYVIAILTMEGELTLGLPSTFALGGSDLALELDGDARWPEASGQFAVDGTTYRVDSQDVEFEGTFSFAVHPASLATMALAAEYPGEGDLRIARVDGRIVHRSSGEGLQPQVVAASAAGLTLLLVLLARPAILLYTRIRADELLLHPRRRALFDAVVEQPGLHLRALHRRIGGAYGPLLFHLRLLREGGYLRTARFGGYLQIFPTATSEGATVLPHPATRAVLDALRGGAPAGPTEIAARAGLSRQLASYHLKRLEKAGLVRRDGPNFRPSSADES